MTPDPRAEGRANAESPEALSLREAIRSFGESLALLLTEHVALLKTELRLEGERLAKRGVLIGVGLLWCCVGYLGLMGALVALLAEGLGIALAALLVGLANLAGGVALVVFAGRQERASEESASTEANATDLARGLEDGLSTALRPSPEADSTVSDRH
jgi:hypothetical protein